MRTFERTRCFTAIICRSNKPLPRRNRRRWHRPEHAGNPWPCYSGRSMLRPFGYTLQSAFDVGGGAGAAVGALVLRRGSDQANDVQKPFGFEGFCHADDGAELMAG